MAKELAKTDPARSIISLQDEVNDLFREFFRGFGHDGWFSRMGDQDWLPAADIEETDDAYVITCDVPGMTREDLKVTVEEGVISIHGERKTEKGNGKHGRVRSERAWGEFTRSFSLPSTADPQKVKAACKDGVLTVTLAKRPEAKPRGIDIEVQ